MSGLFYNLGRKIGPKVRKARWVWQSVAGSESDAVRVEYEVGFDLAREIRRRMEIDDQPRVKEILNKTGNRLALCVAKEDRKFDFKAVRDREPNAFALPGGFIFLTTSILELCEYNQDRISFILAHEMSHVIREHAINRIISNSAITAASRVSRMRGLSGRWLQSIGVQFLKCAYSKEMEFEADKLGVYLISAAGFKSEGSMELLRHLLEIDSSSGQSNLGNYFCSHPPLKDRIRKINDLLNQGGPLKL